MIEYSNSDILNYAYKNGMLDLDSILHDMRLKEKATYINRHNHKVYQGKDGNWYTYFDTENGRKRVKRRDKEALEEAIYQHYKDKNANPSIQDVFNEWIEEKLEYAEIRKQSYDRYQTDFLRFFVNNEYCENFADRKIKFVTEEELEAFIKVTIAKMQLTQKAYSGLRILINGIFKYAKKKKLTSLSITQFMGDIQISRRAFASNPKRKEDEVYQEAEAECITKYLSQQENDLRALGVLLLFYSGLRIGELCALKPEDWNEKYLHIKRTEIKVKTEQSTMLVQEYLKSEAGERYVILTENARNVLRRIMEIREQGEFLFMENGKRIRSNGFRRKLERVCKSLGIKYRPNHKIRKTYGTTLIDAGVDEAIIAEQMGHADISTTKKYYYFSNKNEANKIEQISSAVPW